MTIISTTTCDYCDQ